MHRCGNGKESEDTGAKQLPLLFDVGQSRADDHGAQAMHQAGGQAAQRCPAQRYHCQVLHEDDSGTGGDDAPGGDQAESGGTVGAADSHISDADSGTAGIADEMSVQKDGSPDHRDHGEGSTTDTAEPAGDTVPEGGLSNPDSIFPAVAAVPAEVVDRLDELLADTTGEPATDSKQAEPQPTMGKVEQVIWDEQPTSSLSEAGISGADTNDKVKPEPDANPEGSNSKRVKQKKSKAKTK